jgi:hypothetical protein
VYFFAYYDRGLAAHLVLDRKMATGAQRKRAWRARQVEKFRAEHPDFDPSDGMSALMLRALPAPVVQNPLTLPVAELPTAEYAERLLGKLDDE